MRARNREVNIFNMSLLDILTGMLGAFLFLMLGLVPYYMRAKNGNPANSSQTPPVDTTLNIISRWDSAAKMDFFLYSRAAGWHGANPKALPLARRTTISNGACGGDKTWQSTSALANAGDNLLLACSLEAPADPETMRRVGISTELMEVESRPDGSGMKSYTTNTWCTSIDASAVKPGVLYGVMWLNITKDSGRGADYNQQFDYNTKWITSGEQLPDGALPLPRGLPMPIGQIPTSNSSVPNFPGFSPGGASASPAPH